MKYVEVIEGFREFPDEISLLINISECPNRCPDCHSKHLWEDVGTPLTFGYLCKLIDNHSGITCVGFMGGDIDPYYINILANTVKNLNLKVGWYSGKDYISNKINLMNFDYIKIGRFIKEKGGLDKKTTNQILYKVEHYDDEFGGKGFNLINITNRLQR